jgi:hypothetical protein
MKLHTRDQLDKKPAVGEVSSTRVPVDVQQAVASSVQSGNPSGVVTELSQNDVILGRGTPSILNEGNIRFRKLVQSRKLEYLNAQKRQIKSWIARQVVQAVSLKQGRFLRRIESLAEAEQKGVPKGIHAWVPVHEGTILKTVKQALRNRNTWDEDDIQDIKQQLGSGASGEAAGHTKGITPETYLEGLEQKAILQRMDVQQQAAEQTGVPEIVNAWIPVHEGTIIKKVQQAVRDQDTKYEEDILDVKQQLGSGASGAAAGHTQGITPLDPELESYLEGLEQKAILQRMDVQQQAALCDPCSLSLSIGDFFRARQAAKEEMRVTADQAQDRDRGSILNGFQGIGDHHAVAQQGNISRYPGGTTPYNGGQLHPRMGELRNAPVGSYFSMAGAYQQMSLPGAILSLVSLPPARGADSTFAGSGIAREPARAGEASCTGKETRGESAICAGIERAQQLFSGSLSGSYLKTSMLEMLLLRVLCSRGLPVWEPQNHKSTDARPEGAEAGSYMFTWSDVGSLLARAAKDWHDWINLSSDLAVNDDCRAELRATILAARYNDDPEDLARKTTSLLEKLRNFMDPDDSGISTWFEEELCRWALTLSIADKRLHPVAYTASDFVSAHPQYTRDDDVKTACVLDTQSCHHIILQVANMSRLRSVFLSDMGRGIWTKVDEASTRSICSGQVWKSRPSWWVSTISHDMSLLRSLLESGFLGVLEEMRGAVLESASGRELGLSKASIQDHMELLIPHLHQSQDTADCQAILKGLEDQYFNNALAKPVATSNMDTDINNVQLRPPHRNKSKVNREEHKKVNRQEHERHSGGVGREHTVAKKFRTF